VDDTNLTISLRKQHIDLAKKFNARVRGIFMNTFAALLEQRQKRRHDSIPLSVIYKQIKELEVPTVEEGFEQIIVKKDYEQSRNT
jgi:predicted kinase